MILELILTSLILGVIPAYIAWGKGHSLWLWWGYGALAPFSAIPHCLVLKNNTPSGHGKARCPHCSEPMRNGAEICLHCGHMFPAPSPSL